MAKTGWILYLLVICISGGSLAAKLYGGHDLVTTHLKDAGKEFEAEEFRGKIAPRRAGGGGEGSGLVLLRGTIRNDDGESPSY